MRRVAGPLFVLLAIAGAVSDSRASEPVIPDPTGYVNDSASVMGSWAAKTEALCREIERGTGAEVAVLTVKTTGGIHPQQYAQEVADRWKVGKKGKDNGVLILVASADRKLWIATGYGVEGVLPDGKVGEIRDRYLVPAFREGRYGEGIYRAVEAIGNVLRGGAAAPPVETRRRSWLERNLFPLSFAAILLFLLAGLVARVVGFFRGIVGRGDRRAGRYRGGGFWSGGFGGGGFDGGGFGGFGGGGFGGGGAGGGW